MFSLRNGLILPLLLASASCADNVDEYRERWNERRPAQYVVLGCRTGFYSGCDKVAVNGETIVAARTQSWSSEHSAVAWHDQDLASAQNTIDAAFDEASSSGCDVEYTFNEQYGYLQKVYLDCGEEGFGLEIQCFVADTLDLRACEES